MKKLYIGNLLYEVRFEELHTLLNPYGTIHSLDLFTEVGPDRPHAYAFVVLDDDTADAVQSALDGSDFMGRTLRVEDAKAEPIRA